MRGSPTVWSQCYCVWKCTRDYNFETGCLSLVSMTYGLPEMHRFFVADLNFEKLTNTFLNMDRPKCKSCLMRLIWMIPYRFIEG